MEKVIYEIGNGNTITFIKPKEKLKIEKNMEKQTEEGRK